MNLMSNVKVECNKNNKDEYVIKDLHDIIIGRFYLLEMNNNKRRCNIEFVYYKINNYSLMKESIICILQGIFKQDNIFKINIRVKDNMDLSPFIDLGFSLEGILYENEYNKGEYGNELILGITKADYDKNKLSTSIELKSENLIVRNLTPADAEDLFEYYKKNRYHLEPYEPSRDEEFYTLNMQKKLLSESYRNFLNKTNIDLGIFKDNQFIGKIKISNIVYGSLKSGIIGYSMDKDYCGKGYMKEAVMCVLKYVFEECDLHRIEASVLTDNEKSRNVLRRCGFKLVGINEKYLLIDGRWQDHATYYIVKEDFYKS